MGKKGKSKGKKDKSGGASASPALSRAAHRRWKSLIALGSRVRKQLAVWDHTESQSVAVLASLSNLLDRLSLLGSSASSDVVDGFAGARGSLQGKHLASIEKEMRNMVTLSEVYAEVVVELNDIAAAAMADVGSGVLEANADAADSDPADPAGLSAAFATLFIGFAEGADDLKRMYTDETWRKRVLLSSLSYDAASVDRAQAEWPGTCAQSRINTAHGACEVSRRGRVVSVERECARASERMHCSIVGLCSVGPWQVVGPQRERESERKSERKREKARDTLEPPLRTW